MMMCFLLGMVFLCWGHGPTESGRQLAADVAEALRRTQFPATEAATLMGVSRETLDAQLTGTAHLSLRGVAKLPESVYIELLNIRAHRGACS